jgi:hypothetical protein
MRDGPSKEVRSDSTMGEQEGGQELHLFVNNFFLFRLSRERNFEAINTHSQPFFFFLF